MREELKQQHLIGLAIAIATGIVLGRAAWWAIQQLHEQSPEIFIAILLVAGALGVPYLLLQLYRRVGIKKVGLGFAAVSALCVAVLFVSARLEDMHLRQQQRTADNFNLQLKNLNDANKAAAGTPNKYDDVLEKQHPTPAPAKP